MESLNTLSFEELGFISGGYPSAYEIGYAVGKLILEFVR